jgi:hypothetical protein
MSRKRYSRASSPTWNAFPVLRIPCTSRASAATARPARYLLPVRFPAGVRYHLLGSHEPGSQGDRRDIEFAQFLRQPPKQTNDRMFRNIVKVADISIAICCGPFVHSSAPSSVRSSC